MSFHQERSNQPQFNKPIGGAVTPKTYAFGYILE